MTATLNRYQAFARGLLCAVRKLWTPILVGEGEMIPKWYGCSRWIPYDMTFKEPDVRGGIYSWRKIFYPIPVNIALAFYYWSRYMLKRGFAVPPRFYTCHTFRIETTCPHCQQAIYESDY